MSRPDYCLIRAYKQSNNGDEIVILANDPGVVPDSKAWCIRTRNEFVGSTQKGWDIEVKIKVTGKR